MLCRVALAPLSRTDQHALRDRPDLRCVDQVDKDLIKFDERTAAADRGGVAKGLGAEALVVETVPFPGDQWPVASNPVSQDGSIND